MPLPNVRSYRRLGQATGPKRERDGRRTNGTRKRTENRPSKEKEVASRVNSFSQFWSVLSPSRLASFRSLFSRFTFLSSLRTFGRAKMLIFHIWSDQERFSLYSLAMCHFELVGLVWVFSWGSTYMYRQYYY
jgi:hypothetical protein